MIPLILRYWKLAAFLAVLLALGVQTYRLASAKGEIAQQAALQAQFEADLAVQRAEGVAEGARQQQAAAEALRVAQAKVEAERRASLERRAAEAVARAKRLEALLNEAHDECLMQPLNEDILDEFRQ